MPVSSSGEVSLVHCQPVPADLHCFGCGAGGNVFTFLTRLTGSSFPEVVRDLGQKVGIEVREMASRTGAPAGQAKGVEQLNEAAAAWFTHNLRDAKVGAVGRDYLERRGIQPPMIDRFGIGVAPAEWDGLLNALTKQGFTQGDLALWRKRCTECRQIHARSVKQCCGDAPMRDVLVMDTREVRDEIGSEQIQSMA